MLSVDNVTRRFGPTTAVDGVSFEVPAGELVGFVGANGAGKTTTMRMIMGVLAVHGGDILWDGRRPTVEDRRQFGYMPEERGLYPKQKIADQLTFLGRLAGLKTAEAKSRSMHLLSVFKLGDRASDALESLSLGNQQRVQVAASFMNDPIALVLDEPFSGMDPVAVDSMTEMLRHRAELGVPVLFSSHQLDLVDRLCDRLVILKDGRVVASGTPGELRQRGEVRHRVRLGGDAGWLRLEKGVDVVDVDGSEAVVALRAWTTDDLIREASKRGSIMELVELRPSLSEVYREVTIDDAE
jgi:ABC-2 type transport system ATP-binding protein